MADDASDSPPSLPPPPPPPAPPLPHPHRSSHPNGKQTRAPPIKLKLGAVPTDWFYRSPKPPPINDLSDSPTGPYFVYGTLMDPRMLKDVLGLRKEPSLRPAKIVNYHRKLWGQYPAMLDGPGGAEVAGAVYHVQSPGQGKRLAEYETNSYVAKPCKIQYTDGGQPVQEYGHVFMFVGNPQDLEDGEFDLAVWRRRMDQ